MKTSCAYVSPIGYPEVVVDICFIIAFLYHIEQNQKIKKISQFFKIQQKIQNSNIILDLAMGVIASIILPS